jgi:DMSO/TMAO reductase YedYZ molybdopterin-dependent catalytic subunit
MNAVTRGFRPRRRPTADEIRRLPPGQYETRDFPVLSIGPTPRGADRDWSLAVTGAARERRWSWDEFLALPAETITTDIHCVTHWSKLGTTWTGVSLDLLLDPAASAGHLMARCEGGYTTNLPLEDVTGGKAWIAYEYDGRPLARAHGGPARLLVPHLYFWKSAKWVRELEVLEAEAPGYWEANGYHDRGDPWREQRYQGDD